MAATRRTRASRAAAPDGPVMKNRPARALLIALLLVLLGLVLLWQGDRPDAARAQETGNTVWVTSIDGVIDPVLANYVERTISRAQEAGAHALIVELDTPGGLDSSMRQIISAEIDSAIAVVFYVYPQGSRAASAGVYILMGSDVAAMAPQTNLGSAHPVAMGGEMDEEMQRKVVNDAAAYIRGLAIRHERNAEWAEQAVRESVNLTAEEALEENVIEFVAEDLDDLLQQMDGYVTVPKGITLATADAAIHRVSMGWHERLLHAVVNPNVAFILMLIGIYGLIFELQSPGLGIGGAIGLISLLLAFYAMQVLPVNFVGVALIVVAVILFVVEVIVPSFGALAAAGTVALVLGALLLFDAPEAFLRVDWTVIAIAVAVTVGFFLVVLRAVSRAMRSPTSVGVSSLVGEKAEVRLMLAPVGQVFVRGELWRARAEDGPIPEGEMVEVTAVDGMVLTVRRSTD
jgi:membrane-bound serine protease (ClpP class)